MEFKKNPLPHSMVASVYGKDDMSRLQNIRKQGVLEI